MPAISRAFPQSAKRGTAAAKTRQLSLAPRVAKPDARKIRASLTPSPFFHAAARDRTEKSALRRPFRSLFIHFVIKKDSRPLNHNYYDAVLCFQSLECRSLFFFSFL